MRLHTLRGMKAEDICIAFICIHWSDISRWCGFILSEVCGQRTYTLHSYAYIEVIYVGIVDAGKCYTTYCGCSRKWDGIGYIGTIKFYIYKYFWLNCDSFKMLFNLICGLNISWKQFACWDVSSHSCITQCRYLIHVGNERSSSTPTFTIIITLPSCSHDLIRNSMPNDVCFF
jgi:hypothetical protein